MVSSPMILHLSVKIANLDYISKLTQFIITSDQEQTLTNSNEALKLVKELSVRVDKLEGKEEPKPLEVAPDPVHTDVAPEQ